MEAKIEDEQFLRECFKCPWCPCWFGSAVDYDSHMRKFGEREYDHRRAWKWEMKTRQ